jgi:hypothetical protein
LVLLDHYEYGTRDDYIQEMGSEWGAINETRRILLEDVYFDAARYGGYGGVDDLTSQFGRWGF